MHFFSRMSQLHTRGVTFIEVLVGAAIITLVFGGLMAGFQFTLGEMLIIRAQTGALSLANQQIEYLRSLPYDSVGTVGGIPSGLIPQNETIVLNNITYNRRTLVQATAVAGVSATISYAKWIDFSDSR